MANDRWYNPGDWYQLDDLSGFKIRASRSRRIPAGQTGNLIVAPERWEPQQPQDLVRGIVDNQSVPVPRPRQTNHYTVLATFVTAPSARLSYTITVDSSVGFAVGNNVFLMLDSGENYLTSIGGISGSTITLGTLLLATVGTLYGDPIENTLLYLNAGPPSTTGLWNDSGTLSLLQHGGYPTTDTGLSAGDVWDNGFAIAVVPGGSGSGQSYTFGTVTAGELLFSGAGGVTTALPATAGAIWNNGGELAVA